jgi:hypothetical protein
MSKHELTEIHTKENSFLVRQMTSNDGGSWVYDTFLKEVYQSMGKVYTETMYVIIASTIEIDPFMPLYRPEDLKVKERYTIEYNSPINPSQYMIWDGNTKVKGIMHNETDAQDYCNYLNRQHEVVDVRYDIDQIKKWTTDGVEYSLNSADDSHCNTYVEGCINGYNAAPKHEWNDEDMTNPWPTPDVISKLIWAAEYLLHEKNYDRHGYEEVDMCVKRAKEILKRLEPKPITLEYDEKPEVGEDGYIIIKKN